MYTIEFGDVGVDMITGKLVTHASRLQYVEYQATNICNALMHSAVVKLNKLDKYNYSVELNKSLLGFVTIMEV